MVERERAERMARTGLASSGIFQIRGGYELRQGMIEGKVSTLFLRMLNAKTDAPAKSRLNVT